MLNDEMLPREGVGRDELAMFYEWTSEQAIEAQKQWWRENKDRSKFAVGPVFRWRAAQSLKELFDVFQKSHDKRAMIEALYICSMRDLPIPKWCAFAFIDSVRKIKHFKEKSWDAAFGGRPFPKGAQINAYRNKWEKDFKVYAEVKKRIEQGCPRHFKMDKDMNRIWDLPAMREKLKMRTESPEDTLARLIRAENELKIRRIYKGSFY